MREGPFEWLMGRVERCTCGKPTPSLVTYTECYEEETGNAATSGAAAGAGKGSAEALAARDSLWQRLSQISLYLLAFGSALAALLLHARNRNLQRRLDCIREDWRHLKAERMELKAELCRLKRLKSNVDSEVNRTIELNSQVCDTLKRRLTDRADTVAHSLQAARLKQEVESLQQELQQSYVERDMLKNQLCSLMKRSKQAKRPQPC